MKCRKSKISKRVSNRRFQKKSQMEIMGLAIIVILISIGLLFYVTFIVGEEPDNIKKDYEPSAIGSNFINTLLNTNAPECANTQFDTLFIDCSTNKRIGQIGGGNIPCGAKYSCLYLQEKVEELLEDTLGEIGYEYQFIATTNKDNEAEDQILTPIGNECTGTGRKARSQPLPTFPQGRKRDLYLFLYVCQ